MIIFAYVLVLLIIICVLVVAHEWGHFIVARLFKIRVDDFSVGFGPRILRLGKLGDTEYNIRALPLGGFVRIAGMDADEEPLLRARETIAGKSTLHDNPAPEEKSPPATSSPAEAGMFYSKPLWQRSLVIFAGPLMSFLFGYFIFCFAGCTVGLPIGNTTNRIGMVLPGGEAYKMGLRAGDTIEEINGRRIVDGEDMVAIIHMSYNKPLLLTVLHNGVRQRLTGTPERLQDSDTGALINTAVIISPNALSAYGIKKGDTILDVNGGDQVNPATLPAVFHDVAGKKITLNVWRGGSRIALSFLVTPKVLEHLPTTSIYPLGMLKFDPGHSVIRLSIRDSIKFGNDTMGQILSAFRGMFERRQIRHIGESTGGIIMIYSVISVAVQNGAPSAVLVAGQISISLAILNLMPIPVLDGGHLLTFFIEWLRRGRRFTDQQQQAFLLTGMAIIGILFLLVFTNDIHKLITHQIPQ